MDPHEKLKEIEIDAARAVGKIEALAAESDGILDIAARFKSILEEYRHLARSIQSPEAEERAAESAAQGSPYAVLLLDGNAITHQIKEEHLRANSRGGTGVAQLLNDEMIDHFRNVAEVPHSSRLVIRIFADLKEVSHMAIKAKLVDPNGHPRVLAPFAASFNAVSPYFDFVDVSDKHNVKVKVSENFQLFAKDQNCKRIIFGIGSVKTYVDMLESYQGYRSKIDLLRAGNVDPAYEGLGFKFISFHRVFRPGPRSEGGLTFASASPIVVRDRNGVLRRFHSEGSRNVNGSLKASSDSINNPYDLPTTAEHGLIPVNALGQRIDLHIAPPGESIMRAFNSGFAHKKPCTPFHIHGKCDRTPCQFDHSPLSNSQSHCLRYTLKKVPCTKAGRCRRIDCYYGHVCQKAECKDCRKMECRMPPAMHSMDLKVAAWVDPDQGRVGSRGTSESGLTGKIEGSKGHRSASGPVMMMEDVPITEPLIDLS